MITGKLNRLIITALCLALWLVGGKAVAETWDQVRVFAALASVPERRVPFTEERIDQMLGVPLQSRGTLHYRAPDYLAREMEQASYVIDADTLIINQRGQQRELLLDSHPALSGLATLLRALLSGNEGALQAHYQLSWQGDGEAWQLTLRPRHGELTRWINEARVSGQADRIHTLVIDEASGDQTFTHLHLEHAE